jgi:hypothetical protein
MNSIAEYRPLRNPVSPTSVDISNFSIIQTEPTEKPIDRELWYHIKSHILRICTTLLAITFVVCLFIPGVNIAVLTHVALLLAGATLLAILANGVFYFIDEKIQVPGKQKAQTIFFESLKSLIAPLGLLYDRYTAPAAKPRPSPVQEEPISPPQE